MLVYTAPGLLLFIEAILFGIINHITLLVIISSILPIFLGLVKAYGKGDIPMTFVYSFASILYIKDITTSILFVCMMLFIAEIIFLIIAIKNKKLKNAFQLKEKQPLGMSLLLGTYLMLLMQKVVIM